MSKFSFFAYSEICLATKNESVGSASILTASFAPIASAFLMVGSSEEVPTVPKTKI